MKAAAAAAAAEEEEKTEVPVTMPVGPVEEPMNEQEKKIFDVLNVMGIVHVCIVCIV
jgi:hypothetical protein